MNSHSFRSSSYNVTSVRNSGLQGEDSDVWDDTDLIQAYDEAKEAGLVVITEEAQPPGQWVTVNPSKKEKEPQLHTATRIISNPNQVVREPRSSIAMKVLQNGAKEGKACEGSAPGCSPKKATPKPKRRSSSNGGIQELMKSWYNAGYAAGYNEAVAKGNKA